MTAADVTSTGAWMVSVERQRQVQKYALDARYTHDELLNAAWCYLTEAMPHDHDQGCAEQPPSEWPWSSLEWSPSTDRARNLVRAGALICAELDRLIAAGPPVPIDGPTDVAPSGVTSNETPCPVGGSDG